MSESTQLALLEEVNAIEHVLGFRQIRVGEYDGSLVRLHFWDGRATSVEAIHSHRRQIRSYVLGGSIASQRFKVCRDNSGDHALLEVVNGHETSRRVPSHVRAFCEFEDEVKSIAGESYFIDVDSFHTSAIKAQRAATLIITGTKGENPPYLVRALAS